MSIDSVASVASIRHIRVLYDLSVACVRVRVGQVTWGDAASLCIVVEKAGVGINARISDANNLASSNQPELGVRRAGSISSRAAYYAGL